MLEQRNRELKQRNRELELTAHSAERGSRPGEGEVVAPQRAVDQPGKCARVLAVRRPLTPPTVP